MFKVILCIVLVALIVTAWAICAAATEADEIADEEYIKEYERTHSSKEGGSNGV